MTTASPAGAAAPGTALASLRDRVAAEVRRVVVGQDEVVDLLLAATVVGGHVLLEGVPGVAKTLLARAWSARSASTSAASSSRPTCSRPTSPAR